MSYNDDETSVDPQPVDAAKLRLVRQIEGQIARATGRRYIVELQVLSFESLRELARLLRDLDADKTAAVRRARTMPWRR